MGSAGAPHARSCVLPDTRTESRSARLSRSLSPAIRCSQDGRPRGDAPDPTLGAGGGHAGASVTRTRAVRGGSLAPPFHRWAASPSPGVSWRRRHPGGLRGSSCATAVGDTCLVCVRAEAAAGRLRFVASRPRPTAGPDEPWFCAQVPSRCARCATVILGSRWSPLTLCP